MSQVPAKKSLLLAQQSPQNPTRKIDGTAESGGGRRG